MGTKKKLPNKYLEKQNQPQNFLLYNQNIDDSEKLKKKNRWGKKKIENHLLNE